MTKEQDTYMNCLLSLMRSLIRNQYCNDSIEIVLNMLIVIPYNQREEAAKKFTEIAAQGLSEVDFHYEISQVFKEIMGYDLTSDIN